MDRSTVSSRSTVHHVEVPSDLLTCHPLVAKTQIALEHQKANQHQLVSATGRNTLFVRVGPNSIKRALRILEAVIRASETNGWKVEPTNSEGKSRICVNDDPVSFSIFEKTQRSEIAATEDAAASGWSPRYRFKATGFLTLQISEYLPAAMQQTWSDGRKQRLEDILYQFIKGVGRASDALRDRRLAKEEWQRRSDIEQARRD